MNKLIKSGAIQNALLFTAISEYCFSAQASTVVPPPLPTGSNMVRQHVGMNQDEVKRSQRAHHHNKQHKKNYMSYDTLDDVPQGHNKPKNK